MTYFSIHKATPNSKNKYKTNSSSILNWTNLLKTPKQLRNCTIKKNQTFDQFNFSQYHIKSKSKSKLRQNFSISNKNNHKFQSKSKSKKKSIKAKSKMNTQIKNRSKQKKQKKFFEKQQKPLNLTNKQLLKQTNSLLSAHTSNYMSKISLIFDLVTEKIQLPDQIERFLELPLRTLRKNFAAFGKTQMISTLKRFKNDCIEVYQRASESQITYFLRANLPDCQRWTKNSELKSIEQSRRSNYFANLTIKPTKIPQQLEALSRIENKLDFYFTKVTQKHCYI